MKSRKSIPKWKPKSHPAYAANSSSQSSCSGIELKAPSGTLEASKSSTKIGKPSATGSKKLVDSVVGDAKMAPRTNLAEPAYPSFASGISDCSSCDQRRQTKEANLKSVEEDCENMLEQFTNAFAQIAQSPSKTNDAKQIAVQWLGYANVVLVNIEWLERERSQAADQRAELDENLLQTRSQNGQLGDEIYSVQRTNSALKCENRELLADLYDLQQRLKVMEEENNSFRSAIENEELVVKGELHKLTENSSRVETAVREKEVRWDNLNYHLQKRIGELQRDHQQLKVNYDLMSNALRVGNGGDVDDEPMDVGVLEAGHEAEMVMMKYAHESFICELNKLNCKLWNEKFYKRSRLEEEMKKSDLYKSWLVALQQQNSKYRDQISNLNQQIEDLLDVICSKLRNKCGRVDDTNDINICLDISST